MTKGARYLPQSKSYITDKGNRLTEAELIEGDYINQSIRNAWVAPDYEVIGTPPAFGDVRTMVALEKLIDAKAERDELR